MKKLLLITAFFISTAAQAQIFKLTYNATVCPSPLNATTGVYLYAGANTTNPGAAPTYFADAFQQNLYPLVQTQTGIWEICFNPYQIFKDFSGNPMPAGSTIYSFTINFRNAANTIFTGTCSNGAITIDNPLTNPVSSATNIAHGNVVPTCNVGFQQVQNNVGTSIMNISNPLRTTTSFQINIAGKSRVTVEIYNILGKKVITLIDDKEMAGYNELVWNGTTTEGSILADGCYFYTFKINDKLISTNKLIISRY